MLAFQITHAHPTYNERGKNRNPDHIYVFENDSTNVMLALPIETETIRYFISYKRIETENFIRF